VLNTVEVRALQDTSIVLPAGEIAAVNEDHVGILLESGFVERLDDAEPTVARGDLEEELKAARAEAKARTLDVVDRDNDLEAANEKFEAIKTETATLLENLNEELVSGRVALEQVPVLEEKVTVLEKVNAERYAEHSSSIAGFEKTIAARDAEITKLKAAAKK
jgi:hypothetical protein